MCDFYYSISSPPCRSVLMFAKAVGVELNLKPINTFEKEHLTPAFLALNPTHTIPTLVDNGFSIWESRAILGYLSDKYAKNDSFYPKDAQKRAVVNQRLYFDFGTLFQRFVEYFIPMVRQNLPADPEKLKKAEEAFEFLDGFLAKSKYVAGDSVTIADYTTVVTVSTIEVAKYDFSRFKNIVRWYAECKSTLVGYELNEEGVVAMNEHINKMKEAAQQHKH